MHRKAAALERALTPLLSACAFDTIAHWGPFQGRIRCAMAPPSESSDVGVEQPHNDENPALAPAFVFRLEQWLIAKNPKYSRFWESGILTDRRYILVFNPVHAVAHKHWEAQRRPLHICFAFLSVSDLVTRDTLGALRDARVTDGRLRPSRRAAQSAREALLRSA